LVVDEAVVDFVAAGLVAGEAAAGFVAADLVAGEAAAGSYGIVGICQHGNGRPLLFVDAK
jgi:hypothetical protein